MAVRVRLTRVGSRKNPVWRVVVADGRSKRDGRVLETVGRYNPRRQPSEIVLDRERIEHWIARGAQPSDTVRSLLRAVERHSPPDRATPDGEARRGGAPVSSASPEPADAGGAPEGEASDAASDAEATPAGASEAEATPDEAPAGDGPSESANDAEGSSVADAAPADADGEVDEEA